MESLAWYVESIGIFPYTYKGTLEAKKAYESRLVVVANGAPTETEIEVDEEARVTAYMGRVQNEFDGIYYQKVKMSLLPVFGEEMNE